MKEMLMNLCIICVFAAVFDQMIRDRGCMNSLRTVLGVEIFRVLLSLLQQLLARII